jgi:hypothetical protein
VSEGMAELLLTWIDWVEVEVRGFPEMVERLERLRGAVMVARVAGRGSTSRRTTNLS